MMECKLNIKNNKTSANLVYIISLINFWHAGLCHINNRYVEIISSLGLIPIINMDFKKYEICSKVQITKRSHKNIERNTKLLLIHSDIVNLKKI